ncbi:translation initiation factor IF-2-like [Panthera pardus]|uniref:Translation initiation factor IF-2-like n=1 Tax=Panthera pardus TaxID=9691 RepID=A0A9W2UI06_PANPR|nr:translation initiation factor IF-2-like [Panthera pardus]
MGRQNAASLLGCSVSFQRLSSNLALGYFGGGGGGGAGPTQRSRVVRTPRGERGRSPAPPTCRGPRKRGPLPGPLTIYLAPSHRPARGSQPAKQSGTGITRRAERLVSLYCTDTLLAKPYAFPRHYLARDRAEGPQGGAGQWQHEPGVTSVRPRPPPPPAPRPHRPPAPPRWRANSRAWLANAAQSEAKTANAAPEPRPQRGTPVLRPPRGPRPSLALSAPGREWQRGGEVLENRFPLSLPRATRLGGPAVGSRIPEPRAGVEGAPGPSRGAAGPSVFFHRAATCRPTPRAARAGTGYFAERRSSSRDSLVENVATDPCPQFLSHIPLKEPSGVSPDCSYWRSPFPGRTNFSNPCACVDFSKRPKYVFAPTLSKAIRVSGTSF